LKQQGLYEPIKMLTGGIKKETAESQS
jgi:hypothetical protein